MFQMSMDHLLQHFEGDGYSKMNLVVEKFGHGILQLGTVFNLGPEFGGSLCAVTL